MPGSEAAIPPLLPDHFRNPWLHAGFWRRVAAWFIDSIVLGAVCLALWLVGGGGWLPWWMPEPTRILQPPLALGWTGWHPLGLVLAWLYFALCESSRSQATVGKLAVGLKVTDLHGRRIGFGRATGRYFGKFLSAMLLGIGFLMAGWTARKQALHDLVAGCCVVRREGVAAWQAAGADTPATAPPVGEGMPGWAVALIVFGCVFFLAIPVLGVVAAFAIPIYQIHAVRGQVEQGIDASRRARALVGQYIGERGALPEDNAALGLPRPEAIHARYVSSIRVAGGKVVVTYGNDAAPILQGSRVVISPSGNAAMLKWRCSSPDIRVSYLPKTCR